MPLEGKYQHFLSFSCFIVVIMQTCDVIDACTAFWKDDIKRCRPFPVDISFDVPVYDNAIVNYS